MGQRITAVVENGLLRPTEPLSMPEGKVIEIEFVRPVRTEAEKMRIRDLEHALDELQAEAANYSDAWWDDFERELQTNRVSFEERV